MNHNNKNPFITVVIPTYNRSSEIKRTLESILKQTYANWECIIVDDGSNDNTETIVEKFRETDHRFSIIKRNRLPKGGNTCRNIGIENAKGDYIAMLDSDDEWIENYLEERIKLINITNSHIIWGSAIINNGKEETIKTSRYLYPNEKVVDYLLSGGFAPTPSLFYKRKSGLQVQWDENLQRHQDYDFLIRFCEKFTFHIDQRPLIKINWVNDTILNNDPNRIEALILFYNKYAKIISSHVKYNYCKSRFLLLEKEKCDKKYIDFYKDKCLKDIKRVSFMDYSLFNKPKGIISKIVHRIHYCIRLLTSK